MKNGYKLEIIPNNDEQDNQDGLRILARIIARRFLAEHNQVLADEVLEEAEHEQHL